MGHLGIILADAMPSGMTMAEKKNFFKTTVANQKDKYLVDVQTKEIVQHRLNFISAVAIKNRNNAIVSNPRVLALKG